MLCAEPAFLHILKIRPCISVIPKPYYFYRLVFVNAQHNVDLYVKLRISKGQFSQEMTIAEESNVVEPWVFSDRSENREVKFNLCKVSETNDADLSCFLIWFRCFDAPAMRGF